MVPGNTEPRGLVPLRHNLLWLRSLVEAQVASVPSPFDIDKRIQIEPKGRKH